MLRYYKMYRFPKTLISYNDPTVKLYPWNSPIDAWYHEDNCKGGHLIL